jgi:hypothetical protein
MNCAWLDIFFHVLDESTARHFLGVLGNQIFGFGIGGFGVYGENMHIFRKIPLIILRSSSM